MANPAWVVTAVEPRPDYTLHLTFEDGKKKVFDFKPCLSIPLYQKLHNLAIS